MKQSWFDRWLMASDRPSAPIRALLLLLLVLLIVVLVLMWWWSYEPDVFDVEQTANARARELGQELVPGYVTSNALLEVGTVLLNKPGGYLRNDKLPPGVIMDNIPNWEMGVIYQMRDLARSMRNDFSRSQTQSVEDPDLAIVDPQFSFNADSWLLPSSEAEYEMGIEALESYLDRLADPTNADTQFYTRADNLSSWLELVGKRLGNLSQRLSASVGQMRLNTDLSGDPNARQSTRAPSVMSVKTPWLEIDDVFYEARGSTWALIHFLRAVEVDFDDVLRKKNAVVSLRQIIRELEATQETVYSPIILNGGGFGMFANHSLVMANYISRAGAALIDLRALLKDG